MTSDATWDTKVYFGSGATPPHAIRCPIRRLHGNADAANFYSVPAPHKRRELPAHIAPLRAALNCLVLPKIGTSE